MLAIDPERVREEQMPTARRGLPRATLMRAAFTAIVHQGLLGYVGAWALTLFLAGPYYHFPAAWSWLVVGLVSTWLVYSFAALPAYARARSLRPSIRLVQFVGVASVVCLLAEVENTANLRHAVIATLAAPAFLALSALGHRYLLRRTPTIVVGPREAVERLAERWDKRDDVAVVSTCTWSSDEQDLARVVRRVLNVAAAHHGSQVVIASGDAFSSPTLRHLAWALQRAEVECLMIADMSDHVEFLSPRRVGDQLALGLGTPNDHLMSVLLKATFDRVAAAIALVVLSPLLAAIALAVRCDSSGPAIFRQVRTGRDGVPFRIWKFRTMVVDAEDKLAELRDLNEGAGPLFKLHADPRITRTGRFLRKTSLDELPQLVNVLMGQMSLVGPRPALLAETEQYDEWMRRRLHVKPGITGLWQVSGRSSLSWEESIRVDLQYANNWTLRLDIAILLRTVKAVLARDGAM